MWRKVSQDEIKNLLPAAIEFTGNHLKYGSAMMRVIKKWTYACEHNLTDASTNKRAWIGHAACSLELELPEIVVRMAWKELTDEQRYLANKQADRAIEQWQFNYKNAYQLSIW
jgi:hypothetical protein